MYNEDVPLGSNEIPILVRNVIKYANIENSIYVETYFSTSLCIPPLSTEWTYDRFKVRISTRLT